MNLKINLKKIKELRKAKNLTQKDMAQLLGYKSAVGYWHIENGDRKMKAETLAKIAKILDASIEEFYLEEKEVS